MTLGQYLYVNREARGLTQEAVSAAIGGDRTSISDYENDKTMPSVEKLCLLRRVLDVPYDEILKAADNTLSMAEAKKLRQKRNMEKAMDDNDISPTQKQQILEILSKG